MRILHVTDNYRPFIGGLERAVHSISAAQVDAGHEVTVVTARHPQAPDRETIDGVEVRRLPLSLALLPGALRQAGRVFFPTVRDPLFTPAFSRLLAELAPDVIHAHGWSLYSVVGAASKAGVPVVSTAHDYGQVCALKTMQYQGAPCAGPSLRKCVECAYGHYGPKGVPLAVGLSFSSRAHRKVAAWTGLSAAVCDSGSAVRMRDRAPMRVIPSYVPDEVLNEGTGAARPDFLPAGDYLLYVGAIAAHKGIGTLLEAYARLRTEGEMIPLVLIGSIQGAGLDLDQPGVIVQPAVPHAEVMAAWRHATIGIVPSTWAEPFGQVAVECLAAGTPAIVSRIGGLADIVIDGECGLLVTPGDETELATAISRLLGDPAARDRMGAAGPSRAACFTVSAVMPQIEKVYSEVVSS